MDANISWERACRTSGPWSMGHMSTLVGSMKPVIRFRGSDGRMVVRALHGREAMAMMGWSLSDYKDGNTSVSNATLLSMAGNAFSGFVCGPVGIACIAALRPSSAASQF